MITIWRIIKYGFQNLFRNGWLSVTTIGIMVLTLIVFHGIILFNVLAQSAVEEIKEKVDIAVYFEETTSEDDILNIKRVLEGFGEIAAVEYVSREEALDVFTDRHRGNEIIVQTLAELDENPLLASLNIRARELSEYDTIASYLESPALRDMVESVTFAQNELVIRRLQRIIEIFNVGVTFLTIFLVFLAIMVTLNTISLAIFSNKDQISIMRYVGASNKFIRGPYIVGGVVFGFTAAVISIVLMIPVVNFVSPHIMGFVPGLDLSVYMKSNIVMLLMYQLFLGIGLGVISSMIAVRKYLRV